MGARMHVRRKLSLRYASSMDSLKMLADLPDERTQIEEAIIVLERLTQGYGKSRAPLGMAAAGAPKRIGLPGTKNKMEGEVSA